MNEAPLISPQAKEDPETLVLRGRPRPVIRFRRSVIIAGAAIGSAAIAATAWIALQPPSFRLISEQAEAAELAPQQPPEELSNAPNSYDGVPKLGPPLPGDLGRPILEHQRRLEEQGSSDRQTENSEAAAQQARAAELQQRLAERKAARESALLVQLRSETPIVPLLGATAATEQPDEPPASTQASTAVTGSQARKLAFLAERNTSADVNPHALQEAVSPYLLSAGSIIPASLITGLNSDVPGLVTAQVTENVRDSATGKILLIPQGARLIGSYDSVVAFGQRRALVAWRRILFPDGSSVRIDNWPAADPRGYSGLEDKVDRRTWELLKGVVLSTLLGAGTSMSLRADGGDLLDAMLIEAQQGGSKAGDQLVSKSLEIQPTIKVRPGWPLTVIVHKDLILRPRSA